MKFTLYSSKVIGIKSNTLYPDRFEITDEPAFISAVSHDYVAAQYKDNKRSNDNFVSCDCITMDCDNDHTDNKNLWVTPQTISDNFPGVAFAVHYSRNSGKPKNGKTARPRFHVFFPINAVFTDRECVELKAKLYEAFPAFDEKALDAGRFFFGTKEPAVEFHDGETTVDMFLAKMSDDSNVIHEGSRNSHMSLFAGKVLKRYGEDDGKAYGIFCEEAEKCSPPLDDKELDTIWKSALKFFREKVSVSADYIPPAAFTDIAWENPIPFESVELPDFPVDSLPVAIRNYVSELAESTQTPVDMGACAVLSILALSLQGKYVVRGKADWTEPLNLYTVTVAEPSERKSAVLAKTSKPVYDFENLYNRNNAAAIETSKVRKRILEKKIHSAEDAVAKGKGSDEELASAIEQYTNFREMKPLKLSVDNVTTEKLNSILAENDGRAAIISSEGGVFDVLAGMYSKTANLDVFLKGYSGDCIRVDRIGRDSENITNPALTILLTVQPNVLSGMMQNDTFRGRGLTARFLYSMPKSFVGKRRFRTEPIKPETEAAYHELITSLLKDEYREKPEEIILSDEAFDILEGFATALEPKLKGEYADIADWAGKLTGNILRMSALLCRTVTVRSDEMFGGDETLVVSAKNMANAVKIGEYFAKHAKAAYSLMGADGNVKKAKYLISVLTDNHITEFTKRDIMRKCRSFKSADEIKPVLKLLFDYGYIAEKQEENKSGGRPKGITYLVNPRISEA